jgi:hypothetical protein
MRTRLRLGAAASIGLGALLLATVLASPAFAWHSTVKAEASCLPDGSVLVEFVVTPFEDGHDASVDVFYVLDGEKTGLVEDGDLSEELTGAFDLPAGTTGELTVVALVHWNETGEDTKDKAHVDLPADCEKDTTTSTAPPTTAPPTTAPPTTAPPTTAPPTTAPPTTAPPTTAPDTSVSPTTVLETTTTETAVGGVTTTTISGGQLPFTGAGSSGPMLLAGILLVGGGSLVLLVSRIRDRHAA